MMERIYLLLGSNLGERHHMLKQAANLLLQQVGEVAAASSCYETAPWGYESAELYLNQVLALDTDLEPQEALRRILQIELDLGRERKDDGVYHDRPVDIDILLFGSLIIDEPNLQVPHPHLPARRFALVPLAEVNAEGIHPGNGKTVRQLLDMCADPLAVEPIVHAV